MQNIIIYFIFYISILFSILGFGTLLNSFKDKNISIGLIGLKGLFLLILISYLSNFFFKHDYFHNLLILILGLFLFVKNLNILSLLKKNFLYSFIILISFLGIIIFKNHDDFFYYHFGYTLSLVNFTKLIGIGNFEHGFRTPSSIFYLNSLFYLPVIKYFMMHSGAIFFMIFSNFFLLEKIFISKKLNKNLFIVFLSILSFIFINTVFSRISEHGTDRSALILIFIFAVIILESLNNKNHNFENFKYYYNQILIVLFLIISLKVFYLIYLIFLIPWLYNYRKVLINFNNLRRILFNKFTLFFSCGLILIIITSFFNSGCLIYPASFTCLDNFSWSIQISEVKAMNGWYELWSKAGASPTYRVENPQFYIQNFNWLNNWFTNYFFNKVSDFLLVLLFILIVIFFVFKGKQKIKTKISYKLFYIPLLILFIEWFYNHPALRYGGFSVLALLLFVPFSSYISKNFKKNNIYKKTKIVLLIPLIFFIGKNIIRITYEISNYNYQPLKIPYYSINDNAFVYDKKLKLIEEYYKSQNIKGLLIINKEIIKEVEKNK